jgi:hypothetical protein
MIAIRTTWVIVVTVALALCSLFAPQGTAVTIDNAVTLSNFESPTYTAGTDFVGVDSWEQVNNPTSHQVTPDAITGQVLEGAQSAVLVTSSRSWVKRGWISDVSGVINNTDDFVLSAYWSQPAAGNSEFWFSHSAGSIPSGNGTLAAIEFQADGNFWLEALSGKTDSGVSYVPGDTYQIWMQINMGTDTFTAFAANLTAGGPILNLGGDGLTSPQTAGTITGVGGVIMINDGANTLVFDNIQVGTAVIPDPTTVAFTETAIENVTALSFSSVVGEVYRLRFTSNLISGTWTNTPVLIEGTGFEMFAFDPTGFSTQKSYQVAIEP